MLFGFHVIQECPKCGARVRWVRTWRGKAMPIDADPTPDGNIVLIGGKSVVVSTKRADGPEHQGCTHPDHCRVPDMAKYKCHFATCGKPPKLRIFVGPHTAEAEVS